MLEAKPILPVRAFAPWEFASLPLDIVTSKFLKNDSSFLHDIVYPKSSRAKEQLVRKRHWYGH